MKFAAALLFAASLSGQSIGSTAPGLQLSELSGKPVAADSYRAAATVVIFISTKCPVSNRYNERLSALYNDYSARGVQFFFVNANENEAPKEILEHRGKAGYPFAVYKDEGNRMADQFNARVTPESYVIDREGKLRYHGRIDDSQFPARITENTLRLAIDAVLDGKPVERPEARALGCTIKRVQKP